MCAHTHAHTIVACITVQHACRLISHTGAMSIDKKLHHIYIHDGYENCHFTFVEYKMHTYIYIYPIYLCSNNTIQQQTDI